MKLRFRHFENQSKSSLGIPSGIKRPPSAARPFRTTSSNPSYVRNQQSKHYAARRRDKYIICPSPSAQIPLRGRMTAHVSSFLLNLSVYAIKRSIERSCMYYMGGEWGILRFRWGLFHSTVEVRPECSSRGRGRGSHTYLPLVNSGDNIFTNRDFHLSQPFSKRKQAIGT